MKKLVASAVVAVFVSSAALPRKAHAGALEGALIGAAVGGLIGLVVTLLKQKSAPEPEGPLTEDSSSEEAPADPEVVPAPAPAY